MNFFKGAESEKKQLHWMPTTRCNYKCEYCIQNNYKNLHDDKYLETAEKIKKIINNIYFDKIEIVGGEISILDKKLVDIFLSFNPNNYGHFYFVTNGSNLDWFLPIKDKNHEINVSIHESQREIDDIIYNIEKYRDLGLNIFPSIVLTKYNSEVVRYVKNKINNLIIFKDENNSGLSKSKKCFCRTNTVHIGIDGKFYRCNYEHEEGKENLKDINPFEFYRCNYEYCNCLNPNISKKFIEE